MAVAGLRAAINETAVLHKFLTEKKSALTHVITNAFNQPALQWPLRAQAIRLLDTLGLHDQWDYVTKEHGRLLLNSLDDPELRCRAASTVRHSWIFA